MNVGVVVAVAVLAVVVGGSNIYPQYLYFNTLQLDDLAERGICVLSGKDAYQQGSGTYKYRNVWACVVGEISVANFNTEVGLLFSTKDPLVVSSTQYMGTLETVRSKYNVAASVNNATLFESLHYDDQQHQFMLARGVDSSQRIDWIGIPAADIPDLYVQSEIGNIYPIVPVPGSFYIVRMASDYFGNTTDLTKYTKAFLKVLVVDILPQNDGCSIRWAMFWGIERYTSEDDQVYALAKNAKAIGTGALIMAVFLAGCLAAFVFALFMWKKQESSSTEGSEEKVLTTTNGTF
ncbi:hypothetical protein Pelo_14931 [Pelomyxa schiedti]|nr:hypothetical protein Pelo_14931 [Pelomyxa schiedti]